MSAMLHQALMASYAQSGGGGGGGFSGRYWRLFVTASNGGTFMIVSEWYLRFSGVDLTTSGKVYDAESAVFSTTAAGLFDGLTENWFEGWATNAPSSGNPRWASIDFGSSVTVDEVALTVAGAPATESPRDFEIQYSNDNSNWTTAISVTNETAWTGGIAGIKSFVL